jgi:hypothetical protein
MATGLFNLKQVNQAIAQKAWSGTQKTNFVEYLVVAGGAGGGSGGGGGGGAGGLLTGVLPVAVGTSITATVGGGGPAATSGVASVFGSIQATGGGNGASTGNNGGSGGSGGGGSYSVGVGGQGTSGQGNAGGKSSSAANNTGGGGGAGTIGLDATGGFVGSGGAGIASAISGTVTAYAGGGGGGGASVGGTGGVGGGGLGSSSTPGGSTAGSANTGGGGGGGYFGPSSAGGSGIVIVSYPDVYAAATSTTGSPTVSTSGSGSIYFPDAGGSGGGSAPGYIQYAGTSALAIGTTGTYEFWIYPTRFSTNHYVIDQNANNGIQVYYDSSGNLTVGLTSGGAVANVSSSPLSLNTWTHVAIVFNSGTITIYFNGTGKTLTGTTVGYNMTSVGAMKISGYQGIAGQYGVIGYLTNVRIVKGVAVYTGNFTSPTAPLQPTQPAGTNISAITGTSTSLLLNGVSGAFLVDSSTNSYTANSVSTSTAAPTWGASSPITATGYKNRVYTFTANGSITF